MPSEHRGAVLGRIRQVFASGTTSGLSESELLERFVAEGDELAFEALVQRHGSMVWNVCRRVLRDPDDAEDAFQATFLVMVRKAGLLRDKNRLGPWLYGVAFRTASHARVNAARRHDREARARRPEAVEPDDGSSVSGLRCGIDEEILRLPMRFRQPLILCHIEEKTVDEAARELGLTPAAVRGRLFQARKRLRAGLERRGLKPTRRATLLLAMTRTYPLPGQLVEKTARFALGASGTAALLAKQVASTMLWGQLKGLGLVLGALLVVATAGVLGSGAGSPPAPPRKPNVARPAPAPAAALAPRADEDLEAPGPVDPEALSKLDPYKPGRTRVEVVDAETGKPLQAQIIRTIDSGDEVSLKTDAEGRIDLEHSTRWGDDHILIHLWAEGYAIQRFGYWGSGWSGASFETWGTTPSLKIPEKIVVRLHKGRRLAGRFVNEAGEPLSGVTVKLWSYNWKPRDPHEWFHNVRATSGPDGRWETTSAPEVNGELMFMECSHPEYVGEYAKVKAPAVAELLAGTAVTVLKRGAKFSGRVLDMDGKPVEGAIVGFIKRGAYDFGSSPHTRTDALGRFRSVLARQDEETRLVQYPGLPRRGAVSLLVKAPGLAPRLVQEIKPGGEPVEIRMKKGKLLQGRVVDGAGRSINKAHLSFAFDNGFGTLQEGLDTDSDGRFRWENAPAEAMWFSLVREGYIARGDVTQTAFADGEEHVYRMDRRLTILGNIVDEGTGEPIERTELEIVEADSLKTVARSGEYAGSDWTGGGFGMGVGTESSPGFRVRVRARGYEVYLSKAIPGDRIKAKLNIRLKKVPQPGLSGVVLGPDGRPRPGARVLMASEKEPLWVDFDPSMFLIGFHVETGPDGRFQLPATDDPYALAVVDPSGFARVDSNRVKGLTEIRLEAWSRIEGRLPDGPLRDGERLEWRVIDGKVATIPTLRFAFMSHVAGVDDQGRFVFERVPPIPMNVGIFRKNQGVRLQAITPKPGETVQIRWDETPRSEP
ncbi:sigma-70 family RNA polymerase sigma factor [Singulisphaera sp. PoT]|uniref:sigma-70 family RNA polymerase sigma factor n=1 Tax=Singulisphaera sp. PoT TaxID=3411797 RepID=UPI003BF5B3A8